MKAETGKTVTDKNQTQTRNKFIKKRVLYFRASAQRFALPALGRGRRSRPTRKMIRRRKMLGMCAESPASGARFVGRFCSKTHSFLKMAFAFIGLKPSGNCVARLKIAPLKSVASKSAETRIAFFSIAPDITA